MKKTGKTLASAAVIAAAAVMAITSPAGSIPAQLFGNMTITAGAVQWNTVTKFSQLKSAVNKGAEYIRLKADVEVTETLNVNDKITIDLNGHRLECDGCRAFYNSGTLTVTDKSSENNGRITGGSADEGGAVYNENKLVIEGGIIERNEAGLGGAIYNAAGAELTITGGSIRNNDASENGGGIYAEKNSSVEISKKCRITGNNAEKYGGGIYSAGAVIDIEGGSVSSNSAGKKGGGIYEKASATKVTVSGGTLSDNTPQDFVNSDGNDLKKGTVTVTFDSNGGSKVSAVSLNSGDRLGSVKSPSRDGYSFLGWTLDGSYVDSSTRITEDVTLVAKWEKAADSYYTVTYDSNGGSAISSESVRNGKSASLPTPTRKGYTFEGWYLDGVYYSYGTSVKRDITLVAKWTRSADSYYTVTFESNGGTRVSSENVREGGRLNIPTVPVRDGYTFTGWYLNGRLYDFSERVYSNMTLVAQWEKQSAVYCTVTLRVLGGLYDTFTVMSGTRIGYLPEPGLQGYDFLGWKLNGRYIDNDEIIYSDCTLTAELVESSRNCTVTLMNMGEYYDTYTVTAGTPIGYLPTPKYQAGYQFIGWMLNGTYINSYTVINSDCTLYADWADMSIDEFGYSFGDGGYHGGSFGGAIDAAADNTADAPEQNPNTGVEDITGAAGLSAVFAGIAYLFRRKRS